MKMLTCFNKGIITDTFNLNVGILVHVLIPSKVQRLLATVHEQWQRGKLVFVNLIHILVTWKKGTSTEKLPPSDCPVGMSDGDISLIND